MIVHALEYMTDTKLPQLCELETKSYRAINLIHSVANYLLMEHTELITANDKAFSAPFLSSHVSLI